MACKWQVVELPNLKVVGNFHNIHPRVFLVRSSSVPILCTWFMTQFHHIEHLFLLKKISLYLSYLVPEIKNLELVKHFKKIYHLAFLMILYQFSWFSILLSPLFIVNGPCGSYVVFIPGIRFSILNELTFQVTWLHMTRHHLHIYVGVAA